MFSLLVTLRQYLIFPHFPRIFSANLLSRLGSSLLWGFLALILGLNIYAQTKLQPKYLPISLQTVALPTLDNHLALAQAYWREGLWPPAKRELLLAEELYQEPNTHTSVSSVLGVITSPLDILELWQDEPKRLSEDYLFWQKVTAQYPDYRDGYLRLANIAYQLGKSDAARGYIAKALELDPNSRGAQELLKLL